MYVGRRYPLTQTLHWSRMDWFLPLVWSALVTVLYHAGLQMLAIPWLPISVVGVAVAFYLAFKNSESYERMWEARKIYGAIVNASRHWAYSVRDLPGATAEGDVDGIAERMVHRHVAWMDALRHQLRRLKSWEHHDRQAKRARTWSVPPESTEDLRDVLAGNLSERESDYVLSKINPAAHLLGEQSRDLAELRRQGSIDGFTHIHLQELLQELMTQQGKAERIKNFPFPRQYATVNTYFAWLFVLLIPMGMLTTFGDLSSQYAVWLTIPFSTAVSWVFLTADRIGDWSENPFEGLAHDIPITSMSRGIERDVRQMLDEQQLPEPRPLQGNISF